MMREYRAQLDAERARKLSLGKSHSASKSHRKKGRKCGFCNGMGLHCPDCMCFSLSLVITKWTLFMLFSFFFFCLAHFSRNIIIALSS